MRFLVAILFSGIFGQVHQQLKSKMACNLLTSRKHDLPLRVKKVVYQRAEETIAATIINLLRAQRGRDNILSAAYMVDETASKPSIHARGIF